MSAQVDSIVVDVVARVDKANNDFNNLDKSVAKVTTSVSYNLDRMGDTAQKAGLKTAVATQGVIAAVSDLGSKLGGGSSPFLLLVQQIGGAETSAASLAGFLGNPFGAALAVAGTAVGALVAGLVDSKQALDLAKVGADSLSDGQAVLGKIFDETTGKIKSQNELLRLNGRLVASNLRAEAAKEEAGAKGTFNDASGSVPVLSRLAAFFDRTGGSPFARENLLTARNSQVRGIVQGVQGGTLSREAAFQQADKLDFRNLNVTKTQLEQAIIDAASATLKKQVADAIDKSLDSNQLDPLFQKAAKPTRAPRPRTSRAGTSTPDETIRPLNSVALQDFINKNAGAVADEGSGSFEEILKEVAGLQKGRIWGADAAMPRQANRFDDLSRYVEQAQDLNQALRDVTADGLRSLTDGITDAIMNAHSLGDAFHNVSQQIIADLIRIAVQKAIVAPLANALFGGGPAGAATGLVSKIFHFANGGDFTVQGRGGTDQNIMSINGKPVAAVSAGERVSVSPQGGAIAPLGRAIAAQPSVARTEVTHRVVVEPSPLFLTQVQTEGANAGTLAALQVSPIISRSAESAVRINLNRQPLPRSAG